MFLTVIKTTGTKDGRYVGFLRVVARSCNPLSMVLGCMILSVVLRLESRACDHYDGQTILLNIIKDSIFQYLPNTKTMFMNRGGRDFKTTNNGEHFTFCNLELTSETCLNSISAMLPLPSAFAFVLYSAFAFSINFKGRA